MIILQANKIERSFAGEVLFDNINLQVDERRKVDSFEDFGWRRGAN